MSNQTALEKLAALNPHTEIWWDSSPLIYSTWRNDLIKSARFDARKATEILWDPARPADGLLRGCTTNQPLTWAVIEANRARWDQWTRERARSVADVKGLMWSVFGQVLNKGAAMLEPIYIQSVGKYGHICGQVDPRHLTDLEAMLAQAHRLHALRPNVMVKMPGTQEGIEGIRRLSAEGIATTATLCFSVAQLVAVAEAAQAGYAEARRAGVDMTGCRCNAALMLGRMEEVPQFRQQADERGIELSDGDLRWAGVAIARKAYRIYKERAYEARLLCASMRMGPTVDGQTRIWHLEQLLGGQMVLTIFPNIMAAFMELYAERELAPTIEQEVPAETLEKLLRIPYFAQAYDEHAIPAEEFVQLPGVQITGASFAASMQTIEDYAAAQLKSR